MNRVLTRTVFTLIPLMFFLTAFAEQSIKSGMSVSETISILGSPNIEYPLEGILIQEFEQYTIKSTNGVVMSVIPKNVFQTKLSVDSAGNTNLTFNIQFQIEIGDSFKEVTEKIGIPQIDVPLGNGKRALYYRAGEIYLVDDEVISWFFLHPNELVEKERVMREQIAISKENSAKLAEQQRLEAKQKAEHAKEVLELYIKLRNLQRSNRQQIQISQQLSSIENRLNSFQQQQYQPNYSFDQAMINFNLNQIQWQLNRIEQGQKLGPWDKYKLSNP